MAFITAFLMQWSTNLHIILFSFQQLNNLEQLGQITPRKIRGLANDSVLDGHVLRKADNIVIVFNMIRGKQSASIRIETWSAQFFPQISNFNIAKQTVAAYKKPKQRRNLSNSLNALECRLMKSIHFNILINSSHGTRTV